MPDNVILYIVKRQKHALTIEEHFEDSDAADSYAAEVKGELYAATFREIDRELVCDYSKGQDEPRCPHGRQSRSDFCIDCLNEQANKANGRPQP